MKDRPDFFSYYQELYGERWPSLLEALKSKTPQVARYNSFFGDAQKRKLVAQSQGLNEEKWNSKLKSYELQQDQKFHLNQQGEDLFPFYIMDPASLVAPRSLDVRPGHRVLDMCAAPGGKSLILAEMLFENSTESSSKDEIENSELILNELSADRRDRLQKVVKNYIPFEKRQKLWMKGQDASLFGIKQPESFDRILLDAPCSSESHVLESEKGLSEWTPKRSKGLAQRQYSMISSAFLALKPGGIAVYSTCSIHPDENDGVLEKLLKRREGDVEIIEEIDSLGLDSKKTKYGYEFFPDQSSCGPFFVSKFRKR